MRKPLGVYPENKCTEQGLRGTLVFSVKRLKGKSVARSRFPQPDGGSLPSRTAERGAALDSERVYGWSAATAVSCLFLVPLQSLCTLEKGLGRLINEMHL